MLTFKDYNEFTDVITEATVSAGKYGPGTLFILKNDKVEAFKNKIAGEIKLPDSPVFSKLDSAKVPTKAVILGDEKQPLRAAFDILDGPEGRVIGSFASHEKAIDTYFNELTLGTDINWGKDTPTLETAQCIGVYYTNIVEDVKNQKKVVSNIKKILNNGQDWDTKGKSNLLSKLDTMTSRNYAELVGLIAGMADFMNLVKFKPNIIHGRIQDYYRAEEENPNVSTTGVKANTADMIISSAPAADTINAMRTDSFEYDSKGVITGEKSKIKFVQVSLKKSATGAQLGKVTAYAIKKYGLPSYDDYFTDIVNESFQLDEGISDFLSKAYNRVKDVFDKLSKIVSSFFSKIKKRLKKSNEKNKKSVLKRYQKLFNLDKKDMFLLENHIDGEDYLIERAETQGLNSKLERINLSDANKLVKEVSDRKKKLIKLYESKEYLLQRSGSDPKAFRDSKEINIDIISKLLANSYSMLTVENIIGTTKIDQILDAVIDMHKEVFFGKTSLPLYKVYGKSSGKSYEYMGSAREFADKKKQSLKDVQFPISGLRLNTQDNKYFNIDLYVVSDIKDNDVQYTAFRTGTNASGRFSFNFEGNKNITIQQFNKFLS